MSTPQTDPDRNDRPFTEVAGRLAEWQRREAARAPRAGGLDAAPTRPSRRRRACWPRSVPPSGGARPSRPPGGRHGIAS